jgi:arylsulfatase A-like enzyme
MAPTLLGLADVNPPRTMQGQDLSGRLRGEQMEEPESVYLQSYTPTEGNEFPSWRGVRTARHTFARHEDRPWLLYDNEADPYQLENLAGRHPHARLQAQMDALTMEWFEKTSDAWVELQDRPYR